MENYLFPLKSSSATWLSSSLTSWVIDTIFAFLCGLGLFLLLLPCLQGSPSLPPSRKHRNIREHQRGRNRSWKKSQTVEACRECLKELEVARYLISLLQSQLGKCHDKGGFHQLLCQDQPDEMCKAAPAGSCWPCMECADNVVPSMSLSTSPALPNEHPLPLASTSPQGPMTSLHSISSQPSMNVSEPLEPFFPLECLSPHLPDPLESGASPSSPPVSSASPPLDFTLTLPQCDSLAVKLHTFPQSSSPHIPWPVSSTPVISGIGHSSCPVSALTWWQKATQALCISTSSHGESQEEHLSCHPPGALFCGDSTNRQTETGSLSLVSSNDQELEIQATKRVEIKVWKEKEDGSYSKQMNPEYHLNSLGNIFKSLGANQNTRTHQPIWSTEGKTEQLPGAQKLSYTKVLGDHLQQKYNQLFWGLPSLHSESLVATAWFSESSSALQSPSFLFNGITNACPVQIQAKISPLLSQSQPLSHLEFQSQHLMPTIPPFQPLSQSQVQIKVPLQSSFPTRTPSPQIKDCKMSCPAAQNEPQSPIPTEIQRLKWSLLQKQLECGWTLSSVVQSSQEIFSVFSSNLPEDNWVVSILPENFPISPELRKQLEQHLQKWLIQHRWELPQRIQESLELKQLQSELPNINQYKLPNTKGKHVRSQTSLFTGESSKGTQKVGFQLSMGQGLGHVLGKVSKDSSTGSEISFVKDLGVNFEESDHDLRPSSSESGSDEYVLKRYLGSKSGRIREDFIQQSWVAVTHVFPRFKKYKEKRNLKVLKGWEPCVNTSRRIPFLHPCTREVLESHIIRFWVKHRWGLPLKVLKPINCFKLKKKAQSLPPLQFDSPPPATCVPGAHTRVKFAMSQEEFPQAHLGEKVTKESGLTLERPLLAPSPVCVLGAISSGGNHEPSEPLLNGQEGNLSSHSFTSDNKVGNCQSGAMKWPNSREEIWDWDSQNPCNRVKMAEMNSGLQSLRAQETRGVLEVEESPVLQQQSSDILGSGVLTKFPTRNVQKSNLVSPMTTANHLLPRMYVSQDSGESCLNIEVPRALMLRAKTKSEEQYIDCPTHVFPTEDTLVPWVPHCHLQRMPCGDIIASPIIHGFIADQRSSSQHQEFRILRLQDSWNGESTAADPTYGREDCHRPDNGACEGYEEFQTSPVGSWSLPTQFRRIVNFIGSKCLQKKVTSESFFRKGMRLFVQRIFSNKKGKGQGRLQRCEPTLSTVQRKVSGKSKSMMDGETAEARAIMTAVGQILEEKMALHQELQAIKLNEHKQELQHSACGAYCSYRSSFHSEKRKRSCTTCSHQVILPNQNCSTREKHVKPRQSLKSVRFNDDGDLRNIPSTPPKKTVSPISACQHGPRIPFAPGCYHHCPRHCPFQGGVFPGQP
ncbi:spermatogenesis-associated protein 31A3-like [Talpa occidentalis]|uniref:spermatogenesis-associated protein 31A3-like n=1 Tax=Talpa occidentalis TaxID=50954 RepID=UPI00188EFC47|nr:spermatogenesis-associated protein 31A3-like [Talpa occidentalis]